MLYFRLNVLTHYWSIVVHTIKTKITKNDNPTNTYILILTLTKNVKKLDSAIVKVDIQ